MFWTWLESRVSLPSYTLIAFAAQIISGFLSSGSLHIHTKGFEPWQWYGQGLYLTKVLTFLQAYDLRRGTHRQYGNIVLVSILTYRSVSYSRIISFLYPDSPVNAWFFTEDERAKDVRRIKVRSDSLSYTLGPNIDNKGKANRS